MDLVELNKRFAGYWIESKGSGPLLFAVVCTSARRIVLWPTLEIAMEAKFASCGRGCCYKDSPHLGYKLQPREPQPRPKISASWRRMVADERT
jgi:hypothetical protein